MKYFHGQDQSNCSSKQANDRFVTEAAPLSPSGTERYSKLHTIEPPIEFLEEETRIRIHVKPCNLLMTRRFLVLCPSRNMMLSSKKLQHCHPQVVILLLGVGSGHSFLSTFFVDKKCNKVSCSNYCRKFRCLNTYIGHSRPCDRSKWICYSCSYNCRNCCW